MQPQTQPGHVEFLEHDRGDSLGQRFHQLKIARTDIFDQTLGDGLVIQGVFDAVRGGRHADIRRHLQVETDGLFCHPLPVIDSDDGLNPQFTDEDNVHVTRMLLSLRSI